ATADGPDSPSASPATAGLDYLPASGTLTLAPGETEATVAVEVFDDLLDELDETFTLVLGEPEGGLLADGSGLGTILDDDPPPFVSVGDAAVTEGDPGGGPVELVFPVTLSAPSGLGIAVTFTTAPAATGRPAEPGVDFVAAAGSLAFPPGTTAGSITIAVVPDRIDELDETLRVLLSNPLAALLGDAEGVGTILDDDEARISIGDVTVPEGDSGTSDALFPVRLAVPADREVTVRYGTAPGTAAEGEDYLPVSGVLGFQAGQTEASLAVPVVGDLILEPLEEIFTVELSEPTETTLEDPVGVGTILDDEECPGPNLLANPGAEARPLLGDELGELPAWTEVEGETWQRRFEDPDPAEGAAYFFAGEADLGELAQEVSVRAYEVRIDGGVAGEPEQRFVFTGRVRTFQESPPDTARIVVEYRDRANAVVLDAFDSGEVSSPDEWLEVADVRAAPAGTGWVRVRLVATRFAGQANDGYFDGLSLRSLRAPTLTVSDVTVYEGDSGETPAPFTVRLACPFHREVTVTYATADGTATEGSDDREVSGGLTIPPGETEATVAVPVLGDEVHERHETFFLDLGLDLAGATPAGEVVLLDPRGQGLIVNDDFCPRSHGFWKTHQELWPTDWLVLGGIEYGEAELAAFLAGKGGDQTLHLALQLVATKLNLLVGSDPEIVPTVEAADAFLAVYPPGSDPKGEPRKDAEALKDLLDAYNNSPCQETPVVPE
ncbi:MAG TPA: Calx-beta domain-containing protein, partial [Thermoanaerobaculia bacterium]